MRPLEFREIFALGIEDRIDLLREVEEWIPPFRTTMTPHDNPGIFVDWELREEMLEAARTGTCKSVSLRSSTETFPSHHSL